jgi:hypothetical protein
MTLSQEHIAYFSKDNTKIYQNQFVQPTKQMGALFMEWLNTGVSGEEIVLREGLELISKCSDLLELREKVAMIKTQYSERFPDQYQIMVESANKKRNSFQ